MKKHLHSFIVFCATIFATSAMSQNLQLSDDSGILSNGSDIYVVGDSAYGTIMEKKISVKNISSSTISVKVKKMANTGGRLVKKEEQYWKRSIQKQEEAETKVDLW